jgi:glucosylglycerol 3-phosphatase
MISSDPQLHKESLSLDHEALAKVFTTVDNLLIIQDLDGVCMGLVKDPLTRVIALEYVQATQAFDGHFFVLTNGEHIGKRGVDGIIERAFDDPNTPKEKGYYLPGLAAGGVQWQDRYGNVSHPGVSEAELDFLQSVPPRIEKQLQEFFAQQPHGLSAEEQQICIESSVLDNIASPTANLNTVYEILYNQGQVQLYGTLQQQMHQLMLDLLQEASQKGLDNSFFLHLAPNLGRDETGDEILQPSQGEASGTTDFQFMLRGAIKEAGVIALLNHYYFLRTGTYPLGKEFNARQAPKDHRELLRLVQDNFNPEQMPVIVGVGDTVTSQVTEENGQKRVRRGGSDRNFLQLVQDIGKALNHPNLVVYIDSSGGEVKNRIPIQLEEVNGKMQVAESPTDPDDPLTLNVVFPGGHTQYSAFYQQCAETRQLLD